MEKLKKIPSALWGVILFVSLILRDLYSSITSPFYSQAEIAELNAELGMNVSYIGFTVLTVIMFAVIRLLIFEIIMGVAYSILIRRGLIKVGIFDFKFKLRLFYIGACLVNALISLIYFAIPDYVQYVYTPIIYIVNTVAYMLCFYYSAKEWFYPKNLALSYRFCWGVYFAIGLFVYVAFTGLNLIIGTEVSKLIAEIILSVNVLIMGALALIPYFNLKRVDELTLDTIVVDNPEAKEVFKDLGL